MTELVTITRRGVELTGEAKGEGPEILLLHAGGESRHVWRPVMSTLTKQGFRSVAFDQRGHGDSGGAAADGVLAYGDDAKAMIGLLHKPVVVGGSLGGFALILALEALQADIAGLVLVDVTPAPNPEVTRAYLSPRGGLGASPLVDDILSRSDQLSHIVAGLDLPILLVCGGARSPIDDDARASFSSIAPQALIETVEGAGHLVARDAPAELSQLIGDFANTPEVAARR